MKVYLPLSTLSFLLTFASIKGVFEVPPISSNHAKEELALRKITNEFGVL